MSAKSVGPVACTKPGRQVTPTPPAQHIAGNAGHNGRTQSRGKAAHVRYSPEIEKAAGRQATVQPSPKPPKWSGVSKQ